MHNNANFEIDGLTFKVEFKPDEDAGTPWEREDGHGPVSDWVRRDKRAGERLLAIDRGSKRYYDFEEAVKIAKRDSWGVAHKEGKTANQIASEAAEADFERLRAWCNDQWHYVGVVVTLLDIDGGTTHVSESLWGIEDDCEDYLDTTAIELAQSIAKTVGASKIVTKTSQVRHYQVRAAS